MDDGLISIPKDVLENNCKIGKGVASCIYGVVGAEGFQCAKHTSLRLTLELKAARGEMVAQAKEEGCSLHKDCGCD